jgi:Superfamily II helicase
VTNIQSVIHSLDHPQLTADSVFDAIQTAGEHLADGDRESEVALEIAIRLLEARRRGSLPDGSSQAVEFLAEECGLYPYVDSSRCSLLTQTIIEAHAVNLRERVYLHAKQMQVLLWLMQGDNLVLSAPTSFGKSLLVDALLASTKPKTVVMILPTIALLDECRRRLVATFGEHYVVVTTVAEEYDPEVPTIFVLTQERFLKRQDIEHIDLLFVDEFYKLDPQRDDTRYQTLNLALYRALPKAKQCFMAGPHIRGINLGQRWTGNFRFVQTDYRTVTVNVIDRSDSKERLHAFLADLKEVGDQSSLVFTASPNSAHGLLHEIVKAGIEYTTDLGPKLSSWISKNYHKDWPIAWGSEKGIAIHHGRLPRSLGQLFVQLFDKKSIKLLICTSTLIEGVNTSAANVFVYDKKINRTDFDFFSFANIRGRVGRMMRHFVGNAFLYHEPPEAVETSVSVPVLADPSNATEYLLMNVNDSDLSDAGKARQAEIPFESGLSELLLREHGIIGVELLVSLSERVSDLLAEAEETLIWKGYPDSEQRKALAELAVFVAQKSSDRFGVHTAKQVAWAWSQLNSIKTLPKFLRWFVRTFYPMQPAEGVDAAFQFLQACEFSFPRSLAAVEALVHEQLPSAEIAYGPYIHSLENWFRPQWMKQLDEMGIPLPLSERLSQMISPTATRAEAANRLRAMNLSATDFDDMDILILRSALPSL